MDLKKEFISEDLKYRIGEIFGIIAGIICVLPFLGIYVFFSIVFWKIFIIINVLLIGAFIYGMGKLTSLWP